MGRGNEVREGRRRDGVESRGGQAEEKVGY